MRTTTARKRVYSYLLDALPPLLTRFREEWDEGSFLPEFVRAGNLVAENVASPVAGRTLYVVPQEVQSIDDRLPLLAVTASTTSGLTPIEHADALSEEYRGTHILQIYVWVATENWVDAVDSIEALAGAVAYALLSDITLGADDGVRLVPDSVAISYSEVSPHGGHGALAGASIGLVVEADDLVTGAESGGIVETAEAYVHPALEG
jgi:hypothetical protein